MCVVSMIMDYQRQKWEPLVPDYQKQIGEIFTNPVPSPITPAEILEFRQLLERAREYDKKNNEPDCELQEKKDALLKIAKALGVEIDFL